VERLQVTYRTPAVLDGLAALVFMLIAARYAYAYDGHYGFGLFATAALVFAFGSGMRAALYSRGETPR
jgi:hypothetical protein